MLNASSRFAEFMSPRHAPSGSSHLLRVPEKSWGGPATFLRARAERGAAILMAILTVALVAAVASAVIAESGASVEQLSGRADQAQARWLARGAVDWARNVLEFNKWRGDSFQGGNIDYIGEDWSIKVPPTPVDEGSLSGEIEELSSRFNINTLVNQGVADTAQQAIFERLLINLGLPPRQSQQLVVAIIDWIDSDDEPLTGGAETGSYALTPRAALPPQGPLISINELLAVRGMTPDLLERLRPFIAALPANATRINVNIAAPEVLAAYIDGLQLTQAQQIVLTRNQKNYFHKVSDFTGLLPSGTRYNASQFDVESQYYLAHGRAKWGDATTAMEVVLYRTAGNKRPDIIRETIL